MKLAESPLPRTCGIFLLIVAFCCLPVWSVGYFINQDGSAHLNSSFLMLGILRESPSATLHFAFNTLSVPNSTGHWLMTFLLMLLSPFVVTKLIVTITFCLPVAAAGWLRYRTNGWDGVKTAMLLGAAFSFNWLWLVGFYNFLIGAAVAVFATGLYFQWRSSMNAPRTVVLAVLFLLCYFSHIVSFAVLAGAVLILAISAGKAVITRNIVTLAAAAAPVFPLALMYRSVAAGGGGGFSPVWRSLYDPLSPHAWFSQFRTADPFILISRKSLPFLSDTNSFFAIFTPLLWVGAAVLLLTIATFAIRRFYGETTFPAFSLMFFGGVLAALFAPDDFGLNNGSVLRERILLCSLFLFIPIFRTADRKWLKRTAQALLCFVVLFQTVALWDYALTTDREAEGFLAVDAAIAPDARIATISVVADGTRFHSVPVSMMSNYLGINNSRTVWDNYEIGHHLFPVIGRTRVEKDFVFALTTSNAFMLGDKSLDVEKRVDRLRQVLAENHEKIDVLLVAGRDTRIDVAYEEWFGPEPFFENGHVRAFRHK